MKQIMVSKSKQREEFFKCNPDVNENTFNMYWNDLVINRLPELFPNKIITIVDNFEEVKGNKIMLTF